MPSSRAPVDFQREFTFSAPIAQVWRALAQVDDYPQWWHWLRDFRVAGRGLEPGTVLSGVVVPPVPYRLRLRVVLDECVPEKYVAATVHGDLEGVARIELAADGECTRVVAAWNVEIVQTPLRLAATFTGPVVRWGHDRVVESTVATFARMIAAQPSA